MTPHMRRVERADYGGNGSVDISPVLPCSSEPEREGFRSNCSAAKVKLMIESFSP
jgi:hypothetical protein